MNKKIMFFLTSCLIGSLVLIPLQNGDAVTYAGHDGSVSKYLTKVKVEQYKKSSQYWSYIVMACAKDYPLAIAAVDLKSDTEKVTLGVNKILQKGKCSFYGSVMKAKDGNTLGATLVLKDDAVKEAQSLIAKMTTSNQKGELNKRLMEIYNVLGFIPRF